jgi:dihydroneopterin aldolase
MHRIALEGLDFFAYHGVLPEEQRIGNRYKIDIAIETDFSLAAMHDSIEHTIDYGKLYAIIADIMQTPAKLLEHIAHKIVVQALVTFEQAQVVEVSVYKQNPPLGGVCAWAKITLREGRAEAIGSLKT